MSESVKPGESLFARVRLYRGVTARWPIPNGAERDVTEVWVALCEAVEAAHDYNFEPKQAGDIKPYRRLQAAMLALGLETEPHE